MVVNAINIDGVTIKPNQFFEQVDEFSQNMDLTKQTSRILKTLLRHSEPKDIVCIADKSEDGYYFSVSGRNRKYTILFEIINDMLVLKAIN